MYKAIHCAAKLIGTKPVNWKTFAVKICSESVWQLEKSDVGYLKIYVIAA